MIGCHRSVSVWGAARLALALSLTTLAPAAQAATITTTFAGGNGTSTGTVFFDINVLAPGGITITSFDVNVATTNQVAYSIYTKSGSYVGFDGNAAAWTPAANGTGTGAGLGNPTALTLSSSIVLSTGLNALAFYLPGIVQLYTNGTNTYSNSDVELTLGGAGLGGLFIGPLFSPRTWNGTIIYDVTPLNGVPEPSTGLLVGLTALAAGAVGLAKRRRVVGSRAG